MTGLDRDSRKHSEPLEERVARLETLLLERGVGGQIEIDAERNATAHGLAEEMERGRELSERDRVEAELRREAEENRRLRRELAREEGEDSRTLSEEIRATSEEARRLAEEAREIAEGARRETELLRGRIVEQDEIVGELRVALARLRKPHHPDN